MSVGERRTILIVEDDADLRGLFKLALVLNDFTVIESGDGLDALRQLEQHTPDLIVLDIGLPGYSGLTVREELAAQAHTREIPVLIVTGSDRPLDRVDVACVLRKPVLPDALVNAVRGCLERTGPS